MEQEQNLKNLLARVKGVDIIDVALTICDDEIDCDVKVYKTKEDYENGENFEYYGDIVKDTMDEVEAHTLLGYIDSVLALADSQSCDYKMRMTSRYTTDYNQVKSLFYGTIGKYYN